MKFSSTFFSIILSMSTHVLGQNFADLCDNITLIEPYTLQADCLEGDGTTVRTSTIDLYKCLGNVNGALKVRCLISTAIWTCFDTNLYPVSGQVGHERYLSSDVYLLASVADLELAAQTAPFRMTRYSYANVVMHSKKLIGRILTSVRFDFVL